MASGVKVTVEGLPPVVGGLQGVAADVDDLPMGGIADRAVLILRGYTPKDSGQLARSSRPVEGRDAAGKTAGATQGGGPILYAGPINYGWRAHGIRPARQLERTEERLDTVVEQLLDEAVTDAIQRRGLT